jgi:acyl carrier protein
MNRSQEGPSGGKLQLLITAQVLNDAMSRVCATGDASSAQFDFDTRFADIGMDSLQLAELIIELEEILGARLELLGDGQLETLGDLCRALGPMGELH